MERCARRFMDRAVDIRGAKLKAAEAAYGEVLPTLAPPAAAGPRCAVVGGGPAGLAAAWFLGRAGAAVTVFEKEERLGGVPRQIIPGFRIGDEAIDKDIALVKSMGGEFLTGAPAPPATELKERGYEYVLLASGAPISAKLDIPGRILQALDFLAADKAGDTPDLGQNVAVIGGGNPAMDAARAAARVPGVEKVSIVYRRTRAQMPAAEEELELALAEGVEFQELLNPLSQAKGKLRCRVMELGEPDASGRRRPLETDRTCAIPADTVIAALGATADNALAEAYGSEYDADHLFLLDDAKRGPATVVEAIADALDAAAAVTGSAHAYPIPGAAYLPAAEARGRKCDLDAACGEDCLACDSVCENCVSVCPNRANTVIETARGPQVLHLDRLCNECGNCASFCPYAGGPYRDKFTLFGCEEDFNDSENQGFLPLDKQRPLVRLWLDGEVFDADADEAACELDPLLGQLIRTIYQDY
ncbi:MAG: FAD-dependent oxidoreductase, partial [Firmicutes bacterium]|nr:FAD-dependent oxidoreductase [Bacillota bacterium]